MAKTYWKEIAILEDETEKNDPTYLIEFVGLLVDHKLLNKHMLSALCQTTLNPDESVKMWDLLHSIAEKKMKPDVVNRTWMKKWFPEEIKNVEEGKCPTCSGPIGTFRDELSRKEYSISGMCQKCQDSIFGE